MRKPAVVAIVLLLFSLPMLYMTPGTTPDQATETTTTTITSQRGGGTNYTVSLLTNQNFTGSATGWKYEEWGNNPEAASGSYFTTDYYGSTPGSVLLRLQYTSRQCELGWTQPFTYSGTTPVLSAWLTFRWKCYSYTYAGSTNYVEIYLECPKGSGNWELITHTHFYSSTVWNYESEDISYYLNKYGPGTYQFEADAYLTTASSGTPNVRVLYDDVGISVKYNVPSPPTGLSVTINNGATYTRFRNVTLSLTASGADQMRFKNETGAWTSWYPFAPTKKVNLTAGDGTKTVYFNATNGIPPNPSPVSANIALDNSTPPAPKLQSPTNGTAINNNAPTFYWTAVTDPVVGGVASGLASYTLNYSTDKTFHTGTTVSVPAGTTSYTPSSLADGTWYWRVWAVDNAGNKGPYNGTNWFVVIDTAYPPPPTLWKPPTGSFMKSRSITFTWNASQDPSPSSGIASYTLQYSQDPNFVIDLNTVPDLTGTSCPISLSSDGTWYWRVRAIDKAGNQGSYSGSSSLTVDIFAPSQPNLSSPGNGTKTNVNTPTLTWNTATDPSPSSGITYTLQLDMRASFDNVTYKLRTIPSITGTSYPVITALDQGTWYWRVRAVDNAGNLGTYSKNWSIFVDTAPPIQPTLSSPAPGAKTNVNTPTFQWNNATDPSPSSGIASHTLQYSQDSSFASGVTTVNGLRSNYTVPTGSPLSDGTWYWRVRAVDKAGNIGPYSTASYFIVVDTVNPAAPTLLSPASGSITANNITAFKWSRPSDAPPSSGIASYTLQYSTDPTFGSSITLSGLTANYTVDSPGLADGTWYWRVKAIDYAGNPSAYSGYWSVTIDTHAPSVPILSSPADRSNSSVKTPTLTWSAADDLTSGVAKYTLQYANNPLFTGATTVDITTGTSYTLPALADGTWYWRVNATDRAGNRGGYSSTFRFTVDTLGPDGPTPSSPSGTIADNTPTFVWNDDADDHGGSGVVSYVLQIDTSSTFNTVNKTTITGITSTSYTIATPLADGTWYWRVNATDRAGNVGSSSGYLSIKVDTKLPGQPTLQSPANGYISNSGTQVLQWLNVTDSNWSILYVDNNTGFSSPSVYSPLYNQSKTISLSNGQWYWKVGAHKPVGDTNSTIWSFFLDTVPPDQTNLSSPSNGTKTNVNATTFTWSAATDSSPSSGIAYYILQYTQDPNFITGVTPVPGLTRTWYVTPALIDGTWYWRVRAIDKAGNLGSYSANWSLVVDTVAPTQPALSSPPSGTKTNVNTPTFSWVNATDATSGVASHALQYSKDPKFLTGITAITGLSSSYTVPVGSPLSDGIWYWRVRAIDKAGNTGSYCANWSIVIDTVSPDVPTLAGPLTGYATNHSTPTFNWGVTGDPSPSSGITYTLQIDNNTSFNNATGGLRTVTDLADTNYAVPGGSPLSNGTWYWRVRAVDNAGNLGSYSGYWHIIIDTVAPDLPTLISLTDGAQTNITRPVLVWNSATDATSGVANYTLQYANNPLFTGAKTVSVPTGMSYTFNISLADGTWYWHVKATDRAGNSGSYSGYWNFTVDTQPPTGLTLSAVGGGYTNSLTITLSITATGAQNMSLSSDGVNWVEYNFNVSKLWTLSAGDGAKQVYMKCRDAAGNIAYLPGQYIQIILDTIPPAPPKASESPWIPAPGSVTSSNKTALQWPAGSDGDGSGIASYSLQIDTTPTFGSPNMRQKSGLTGTNYTISSALNDGIWYWRINATDRAGNTGPYSTFSLFNISTIPPDRVKSGYKPANNSLLNLVSPLFQWDNVIGAYRYHIQIDRSLNFNTSYLIENVNLSSNRFSPSIDNNKALNDSIWYWRVEALSFSGAPSGYSNISILTIDLTPPSNPQPISPPDQGATNEVNSHKFQWSKVQDATNYWVQLDSTPDFNSSDLHVLPGIEDPNCTINRKLDYGYWYWHVVALDPAGNIGDFLTTPTCRFIVDTISPSQPTPRSPVEGYLTNRTSLKLTWYEASDPTFNGVSSGVANYTLWLDNTTAFNSDNLRKITKLIGTSYNLTSPLRDGTWYWFVNATDRAGNTGPGSIIQRFMIDTVPPSPPPILSMSPNGVTVYVSKVTLTWNASSDPSGVTGYMIQIDISDKFDSVDRLEYKIGNQTTFTPDKELPNGQWYWRIAAIDAAGNLGAWSAPPVPFVVNVVAGLSPMMIVIVGGGSSGAAILAVLGYVFYRRAKIPFVIKKIDQSIKLINKGEMPPPVPMRSRAEIVQTIFQDKVAILSKEKIEELEAKKGKRAPEKPEEPTEKKALEAKPKEAEPKKEVEAKPKAAKTVTPSEAEEANVDMIVKELEKLETKEEVEPSKESEFIRREREELEKPKKKKKE